MKIKFLSVILCSFATAIIVSSCLSSDEKNIEYSSDDTIHAFAIDTIYGENYAFTIDNANNKIYNVDSLPVSSDTIINKVLIKTLTVSGYVTSADTLFNVADSLDLSKTMEKPLELTVHSADGKYTRKYSVEVRRHKQDPDSLNWNKMTDSFSAGEITGTQKSVVLNNRIWTYGSYSVAFSASVNDGKSWTKSAVTGLPADTKMHSLMVFGSKIFAATQSGKLFYSENGTSWSEWTALSGHVVALTAAFPNSLAAVVEANGKNLFAISDNALTSWQTGLEVPAAFPLENISTTVFTSRTQMTTAFIAGKSTTNTTPWFSFDGLEWIDSETTSSYALPAMTSPYIMRYSNKFYAFGGDFSALYVSEEGIVWKPAETKTLLPSQFKGRQNCSAVVDANNYIWIMWSKTAGATDEVWRGRINKLGFIINND